MFDEKIFEQRASQFLSEHELLTKKHKRLSLIRIVSFVTAIVTLVYLANIKNFEAILILMLVAPILFGLLIKYHNKVNYQRDHAKHLSDINKEETLRLKGDLSAFNQGEQYKDELHPYSGDLDIFGNNSIYQLLNRCTTQAGGQMLAAWLQQAAQKPEILKRQDSVKELAKDIAWRQNFQASGRHFEDQKSHINTFMNWVKEPKLLSQTSLYRTLGWVLPAVSLTALGLLIINGGKTYGLFASLIANGFVLKSVFSKVKDTADKTYDSIKALKAYAALITMIETQTFQSKRLNELQQAFAHDSFKASEAIHQLQKLLDKLQSRGNLFYIIIDLFLLADIHMLLQADKWKRKYQLEVSQWFASISEFEVFNSLAGYHFSNPDFAIPEISETPFSINASQLAHPLIKAPARVSNDFQLHNKGTIIIITGSNMSGKSTFLRTIGINAVLALMGAPVCAASMTISPLLVFTGMRTQDNLEESVSSFYAELKRIKQLLTILENNETPVLFMLDEILKGTNSKDRHLGAVSLVKQLGVLNAFGFVSTHDLELGELSKTQENIENYSFNSRIENDEIYFDYKLHDGICKSFNASKLMQKMGIAIET